MQKEIKQTWYFDQSPQEVWEYLTKPELIEQWLMKNDFQPLVGHKFRFLSPRGEDCDTGGLAYCEVLEVQPFSMVSYSWRTNSMDGGTPYDSMVTWTLTPTEQGTKLQLVHDGFTIAKDHEEHDKGWAIFGNNFIELLNTVAK